VYAWAQAGKSHAFCRPATVQGLEKIAAGEFFPILKISMKPLIPILVVATTSLAVASVQFANQASDQRKRADAEVQLRQKQEARVAELERHRARLEQELATVREQNTAAPAPVAAAPRPANARSPGVATFGVVSAAPPGTPPPPPFEFRGRGPMESPAGRNFMRSRMKSSIRRMYGDAGQAMGLSPEKSSQLLDLLADQQTRNFGGDIREKVPAGETIQQYMQDQQKKNNEEVISLIGQDKADDWAAYQKSLPDRAQLGMVRDQLEQAGVPMTDSQRTQMLAAISEESQRLPRPTPNNGLAPEEMMAQYNQWQTEYDKALLDRAKQVLNTEQYNAYKDFQDFQTEMRNNMPRGPNGVAGGGMVLRSVTGATNGVAAAPMVNFQMAVPAQPVAPAETPRR
jgi:hypothetical protein